MSRPRQVRDLGLPRRVLQDRGALRERGGHHEVLGARHRHEVEHDPRALEPRGPRLHVALGEGDLGAEPLEPLQVKIDRPHPDRAAAGHRDACPAGAGQERAEDQHGRPHGRDQLVRRLDGPERRRPRDGVTVALLDLGAEPLQQGPDGDDIGQARNVLEHDGLRREERGGQERQGRVLRRADTDLAAQRNAAFDDEPGRHLAPSAPRVPARIRGSPGARALSAYRPAARTSPRVAGPCSSPSSTSRWPPGRSHAGASASSRRITLRPSASPVERTEWLPLAHLDGQRRQNGRGEIGRVGHDQVHLARGDATRQRSEEVPLDHLDTPVKAEATDVRPGTGGGRPRLLDGPDGPARAPHGQSARDGARSRAQVKDRGRSPGDRAPAPGRRGPRSRAAG